MLMTSARMKLFGGAVLTLLILTTFCGTVPATTLAATPTANPDWQDTGLTVLQSFIDSDYTSYCFDATHPGILYVSSSNSSVTFVYDWQNNKQLLQLNHKFTICNEYTGQLYGPEGNAGVRFSLDHPEGQSIQYVPDVLAQDGTGAAYKITTNSAYLPFDNNRLYFSPDNGQTWIDRGLPFRGKRIESVTVVPAYAGAIYASVLEKYTPDTATSTPNSTFGLYFSADGGQNWEKRSEFSGGNVDSMTGTTLYKLEAAISPLAPINTVIKEQIEIDGEHSRPPNVIDWLSNDGGRSFPTTQLRRIMSYGAGISDSGQVYYTPTSLVRISLANEIAAPSHIDIGISTDNGANWQNFPIPYTAPQLTAYDYGRLTAELLQVRYAPNNFFLHNRNGSGDLWYSPDGAHSWQKLAHNMKRILVTPYAPRTLIGLDKGKIYRLNLPQADASLTSPVAPSGVPNSTYFAPTGHNLPGIFKNYWEQHGGLAQFGYPRTEPFLEVNPSDGRIYSVQYFERNRFEYHSEYAGTPYEVELGLLGNQLTEDRRSAGEAPFQRVAAKQDPASAYFNETGHNLQGVFKEYWEQHGGLSLYGYPISEVFDEVNPDDGQHYQVQYFERNRFEYHPNNADPYKVLLGLLGNTLLKGKGWL